MKRKPTNTVYVVFKHGKPWGVFSSHKKVTRALAEWSTAEDPDVVGMVVDFRLTEIGRVRSNSSDG